MRVFFRTLFGESGHEGRRYYERRMKMNADIAFLKHAKYEPPFVCYTFGTENHEFLLEHGIDSRLVDERPIVWDLTTQFYRHKLESFDLAMQDFDEAVFLDWDTVAIAPLPDDFWDVLGKKSSMQAILHSYRCRKVFWRKDHCTVVPSAAFVYLRDKAASRGIIDAWEWLGGLNPEEAAQGLFAAGMVGKYRQAMSVTMSAEVAMARYIDEIHGGWMGVDHYWERHEPDFFTLDRGVVFPVEKLQQKSICFQHFNVDAVAVEMDEIRRGNLKHWQKGVL